MSAAVGIAPSGTLIPAGRASPTSIAEGLRYVG
jgi:hypothetical protein